MTKPGQIIVLNGAPRSGKSSIAAVIQETFDGVWINLGVDSQNASLPHQYRPGIGLRPGGERPDLEPLVQSLYAALYRTIAVYSRLGFNVVVDLGHHDAYSQPLKILADCAALLVGLPVFFVGVRCPVDVIMLRRLAGQVGREEQYVTGSVKEPVPAPVLLWQREVHVPGIYDLEVDTSIMSAATCAEMIRSVVKTFDGSPTAHERLVRNN